MRLRDMSNDEEEGEDDGPRPSKYPYNLCFHLTEKELERLGLDDEVETGDYLHCVIMAKATSVTKHDHEDWGKGIRVELQIVAMGVEDENTEYDDECDEAEE